MTRALLHEFRAVSVTQPIGTFYVTAMPAGILSGIARADVRRFENQGTAVEEYVGIQRKLDQKRKREISQYVREGDSTFPTSIVIAIEDQRSIEFDSSTGLLSLYRVSADEDGPEVTEGAIATILDGQHRLAGLSEFDTVFDLPVTIFPEIDMAEKAYIFATVNLAQTKVNSSLAYDLLSYARSRSPERSCHDVAVALNDAEGSPFEDKIKRLGSKTPGVQGETLSQATFVRALLPYISETPRIDREDLRNGIVIPQLKNAIEFKKLPLRNFFISEQDDAIVDIIWDYFDSVRKYWSKAWASNETGQIIKRTNGFRAFMNVFGSAYSVLDGNMLRQPTVSDYTAIWENSGLTDEDFNRETYLPGTSGEKRLTASLSSAIAVFRTKKLASRH